MVVAAAVRALLTILRAASEAKRSSCRPLTEAGGCLEWGNAAF